MYCGKCGAEIKDKTARFCDRCGAKLEDNSDIKGDYGDEDTYNGINENTEKSFRNNDTQRKYVEDEILWDDGMPEVPDNKADNSERKKWLISIGCTAGILVITAVILVSALGKNSGENATDIVVNTTQIPKAEASQNSVDENVKVATAVTQTPVVTEAAQELELSENEQNISKKQPTIQPSQKSTESGDSQAKEIQTQKPQTQEGQDQKSTVSGEENKELEALENVPVQEYTLQEETTQDSRVDVASIDECDDYIFPESDSVYLTKDQLEGFSKDQMAYARNEIYARHGRRFRDQKFQNYFDSKPWYVPQYDPDQFDAIQDTIFNEYEKANARLILEVEKEHGYTY